MQLHPDLTRALAMAQQGREREALTLIEELADAGERDSIFRSQGPDGGLDPLSEHAGQPVTEGAKYIGSRWIRAARYSEEARLSPAG